jgi:hypothetical protein
VRLHDRVHEDVLSVERVSHVGHAFKSRSTVGLMIIGTTVDNTIFGGPAYNSKQLDKGDVLLQADGAEITAENLHALLLGVVRPPPPSPPVLTGHVSSLAPY